MEKLTKMLNAAKTTRIMNKLLLYFLVLAVTAASFSGFFLKWSFRDGSSGFGLVAIMEGTADRPFVHRQLVPQLASGLAVLFPERAVERFNKRTAKEDPIEDVYAHAEVSPEHRLEYYLVFLLVYGCFFAATMILRDLLRIVTGSATAGMLTALLFALLVPFFEQVGGYYYDFVEMLFLFMGARYAVRGNIYRLIFIAPLATANKEAFFYFLPMLLPLLFKSVGKRRAIITVLAGMLLSGLTYLYIAALYAGNPGGPVEVHIMEHVTQMIRLKTYYVTSFTYGLPLGARLFFLHIIFVAFLFYRGWRYLTPEWRAHVKLAAAINLPLYFLFCAVGELRNLSMLYVSFMCVTAFYIREVLTSVAQREQNML